MFRFVVLLAIVLLAGLAMIESRAPMPKPGAPYHHMTEGFRNPPDSPVRHHWSARAAWLASRLVNAIASAEAAVEIDHVMDKAAAREAFQATAGQNTVTWIGHMTMLIRLDGKTILTDPWLTDHASPIPPLGPRRYVPPAFGFEDLPPVDIVIVSHSHYDHLDVPTIAGLPGRENITAIVPLGLGRYFSAHGYGRVVELDWEQTIAVDELEITALPVIHWSKRSIFATNDTLWAGFAIAGSGGQRIYFGGDAEYGPVYHRLAERHGGFDLAIISIGAFLPRRVMHGAHCVPADCLRLAADLRAHTTLGVHWGTVQLGDDGPREAAMRFRRAAERLGLGEERAWLMKIGETRLLPRRARDQARSAARRATRISAFSFGGP